ncbi:MAG TPA: hypothetical protein VFK94_00060 [Patescibacteria group bacterium]|nr:hypothetical protein [Patescibacteria group bacterium]
MAQRNILENSIQLLNTLRGPAKILYAPGTLPMPLKIEQVIDPTTGAPASGWSPFGLTRGGINVGKNLDIAVRDDVDQILGAYDQDITDRSYTVVSQLAEVLDRAQLGIAFDMGVPTIVSTSGATQVMVPLDDGNNKTEERRIAVVFPKPETGKVVGFVFRRAAVSGGEKVLRFDKTDPASPPLEFRAFPEIATTIPSEDAYGRLYDII